MNIKREIMRYVDACFPHTYTWHQKLLLKKETKNVIVGGTLFSTSC